jgi:hypothetical protein
MTKPVKRVDLSKLNPEQRAALIQWIKDIKTLEPVIKEVREDAQTIFAQTVKAPELRVAEAPLDGDRPQELWHVGAPEVNYVDHIERDQ